MDGNEHSGVNDVNSAVASSLASSNATCLEATLSFELKAGLPVEEADRQMTLARRTGEVGARVLAFHLHDMAERGTYQQLGYSSAVEYAHARQQIERTTARQYIAVARELVELPLLDRAFCEERIGWSQLRLLVRVAVPETESIWLEWAQHRTVQEVSVGVVGRQKGELPADPSRVSINHPRFRIGGRMDLNQKANFDAAKARFEQMQGTRLSEMEFVESLLTLSQRIEPDGTIPGWKPVKNAAHRVVIRHDSNTGETSIMTADGWVPLDEQSSSEVLRQAGHEQLAKNVPDHYARSDGIQPPTASVPADSRTPVAPKCRDRPTPAGLREKILDRDGRRCVLCGSMIDTSVDHAHDRQFGGPTNGRNLGSLCRACHSVKSAGLMFIDGDYINGVSFTDRNGRDLKKPSDPAGIALRRVEAADDTPSSSPQRVRFGDLPAEVDADWLAKLAHLLKWNERLGVLEFEPGQAREPIASPPSASSSRGLGNLIGQTQSVENLQVSVRAAQILGQPLEHSLFVGPPGLGKTTLAQAASHDLGTAFHLVNAPLVKESGVLMRLLSRLEEGAVLFIDEIHRLPAQVAETLYQAMDDCRLTLTISHDGQERQLSVRLRPFTLMGATSEPHRLLSAHLSRFQARYDLEFYGLEELADIIQGAADVSDEAARRLAAMARGIPREALALVRAVCNEAAVAGATAIDLPLVRRTLDRLRIDDEGLRPRERTYLAALGMTGEALGLNTIAARLGMSKAAVAETIEPPLIRAGFVIITAFGRVKRENSRTIPPRRHSAPAGGCSSFSRPAVA